MKVMKKKKNISEKDTHLSQIHFCAKCDDIEDLALSDESADVQTAKERFKNCCCTGKFDGDICGRVFITDSESSVTEPDELPSNEEEV